MEKQNPFVILTDYRDDLLELATVIHLLFIRMNYATYLTGLL